MKVCHFTSAHPSDDIRVFVKECSSLANVGHEVYLVAKGESRIENNVTVVGLGNPSGGRLTRMSRFAKMIYRKAKALDCDVYHFHDPELLPYGIRLKKAGKKVIFDSHEDVSSQIKDKPWIPKILRGLVSSIYRAYETYAVKKFDAVVSATPHIAEAFKGRTEKVIIVNNYPKFDDIRYQTKPFSKRERVICYAGGISEIRGEKVMAEAMKDVDGTLILAGNHKIGQIGVGEGLIEYIGLLDREGINNLYGRAMVGLCVLQPASNYIDSQPIKMYEYMAAGLPYICSDFPAWKALTDKSGAGVCINPNSPKELSAAINKILDNPDMAQNMGTKGREAVEKHYTWEVEFKELRRLYKCLSF